MSPWFRDRLQAVLGPLRVAVVRSRRGLRRAPEQLWETALEAGDDLQDWRAALAALEAGLAGMSGLGGAPLAVRLSNQFVRYTVLPWSDGLRSEAEVQAFARHRLRETYGDIVEGWALGLAAAWPGRPRMVGAVEQALLSAIGDAARRAQLRLRTIEPQFAALADRRRRQLRAAEFWFAQCESGRIVLGRASRGEWVSLVTARDGGDPARTVLSMLARDSFTAGTQDATRRVYTDGMTAADSALLAHAGWDVAPTQQAAAPAPATATVLA